MSRRVSSSNPNPHDRHTRAAGGGAAPPGAEAAQCPQNQAHSTAGASSAPCTSLRAGRCAFMVLPPISAVPPISSLLQLSPILKVAPLCNSAQMCCDNTPERHIEHGEGGIRTPERG